MNKLEINLKACEMLGQFFSRGKAQDRYDNDDECPDYGLDVIWKKQPMWEEFDLFTKPSDTLAVVKMLGEKHGYDITANWAYESSSFKGFKGWNVDDADACSIDGIDYKTYEEAVGAAVEAI